MNERHPFKWLTYNGERIRIDRDIAPLISDMWKLGINTTSCCQATCSYKCGHKIEVKKLPDGSDFYDIVRTPHCKSHVWIAFASAYALERFYNIVAVYDTDRNSMYGLINGWGGHDVRRGKRHRWQKHPDNWEIDLHMPNEGVEGYWKRFKNNIPGEPKTYLAWEETGCVRNNFIMQPQIHFPRKHLPYVMEKIHSAAGKKK